MLFHRLKLLYDIVSITLWRILRSFSSTEDAEMYFLDENTIHILKLLQEFISQFPRFSLLMVLSGSYSCCNSVK